jgi:hypothetical protein
MSEEAAFGRFYDRIFTTLGQECGLYMIDHDAHVQDWRAHLKAVSLRNAGLAALQSHPEAPFIEAAKERRARRNAKRRGL